MPPVKSRAPARSARRPATGMKLGALAPASGRRAQRRPSQLSTQLAAFVLAGGAFILAAAWLGGSLNDTLRAANNGFYRFAIGSGFGVPQIEIKGLDAEEEALLRGALLFEDGEPIYRADPKTLRARAGATLCRRRGGLPAVAGPDRDSREIPPGLCPIDRHATWRTAGGMGDRAGWPPPADR